MIIDITQVKSVLGKKEAALMPPPVESFEKFRESVMSKLKPWRSLFSEQPPQNPMEG